MAYRDVVLADSPSVYYRLGDTGAPAVPDAGAAGVNAAMTGTVTFAQAGALAGDADTAVSFPGTAGSYLMTAGLGGNTDYDLNDGPFSIEFWYKAAAVGANQAICARNNAWLVRMDTAGHWQIQLLGTGSCFLTTAAFTDTAARHHVVVTRDTAASPVMHIYVDGADQAGTYVARTFPTVTVGMIIGGATATTQPFSGLVDELALYKTVLSQARVTAHYQAGTTVTKTGAAAAGAAGTGPETVTAAAAVTKTGGAAAGAGGGGPETVTPAATIATTGGAAVGVAGTGPETVTPAASPVKTGGAAAGGTVTGTRLMVFSRTGSGAAGGAGTGTRAAAVFARSSTCEGTPGTLTTSNTAGPDQFTDVTVGAGTLDLDAGDAHTGATSVLATYPAGVTAAPRFGWTGLLPALARYQWVYYQAARNPGSNAPRVLSAGVTVRHNANGTFALVSGAGPTLATTTWTCPAGAWVRVELDYTITDSATVTGTATLRVYSGANVEGGTPDTGGTVTGTGVLASAMPSVARFGGTTTYTDVAGWWQRFDDPGCSTEAQRGPWPVKTGGAAAAGAGTGPEVTAAGATVTKTGGGAAGATGWGVDKPAVFPSRLRCLGQELVDANNWPLPQLRGMCVQVYAASGNYYGDTDFAAMYAKGVRIARIIVHWDRLEPTQGSINMTWVTSNLDPTIAAARTAGMYCWIGFYYGPNGTGMPSWASAAPAPYPAKPSAVANYVYNGQNATEFLANRYGNPANTSTYAPHLIGMGANEPTPDHSSGSSPTDWLVTHVTEQAQMATWARAYAPDWIHFFSGSFGGGALVPNAAGSGQTGQTFTAAPAPIANSMPDYHHYVWCNDDPSRPDWDGRELTGFEGNHNLGRHDLPVYPPTVASELLTSDKLRRMNVAHLASHVAYCATYNVPLMIGECGWEVTLNTGGDPVAHIADRQVIWAATPAIAAICQWDYNTSTSTDPMAARPGSGVGVAPDGWQWWTDFFFSHAGGGAAGACGGGAKLVEAAGAIVKAGGAGAGAAGGGTETVTHPATVTKAGGQAAGGTGGGTELVQAAGQIVKVAGGAAGASGGGAKTVTHPATVTKAGGAAAGSAGGGGKAVAHGKIGGAGAGAAGGGPKQVTTATTSTKAGGQAAGAAGGGTKLLTHLYIKAGGGPAAGTGGGTKTLAHTVYKLGGGGAAGTGGGTATTSAAITITKAGGAAAAAAGGGALVMVYPARFGTAIQDGQARTAAAAATGTGPCDGYADYYADDYGLLFATASNGGGPAAVAVTSGKP